MTSSATWRSSTPRGARATSRAPRCAARGPPPSWAGGRARRFGEGVRRYVDVARAPIRRRSPSPAARSAARAGVGGSAAARNRPALIGCSPGAARRHPQPHRRSRRSPDASSERRSPVRARRSPLARIDWTRRLARQPRADGGDARRRRRGPVRASRPLPICCTSPARPRSARARGRSGRHRARGVGRRHRAAPERDVSERQVRRPRRSSSASTVGSAADRAPPRAGRAVVVGVMEQQRRHRRLPPRRPLGDPVGRRSSRASPCPSATRGAAATSCAARWRARLG